MIETRNVRRDPRSDYDALYARGFRNLIRYQVWLLGRLGAQAGMSHLDVACGRGLLLAASRTRRLKATGLDHSRVAVAQAAAVVRKQCDTAETGKPWSPTSANPGPAHLVRADGEQIPFSDGAFDIVTNMGGLVHYDDPLTGAQEMVRVLKPGGRAAVLLPNLFGLRLTVLSAWRTGELLDDGQPIQRYGTVGEWRRLLTSAGFTVDEVAGHEAWDDWPRHMGEAWQLARHPSRLLIPFATALPPTVASQLVFFCSVRS